MPFRPATCLLLLALAAPAGATPVFPGLPEPLPPPELDDPGRPPLTPAEAFFASMSELCGHSFVGTLRADTPRAGVAPSSDSPFAHRPITLHVRDCDEDSVRMPLLVGADATRTWRLDRTATGLRLKHDHRRADGAPDTLTNYGGDSVAPGTATRQAFPADAESAALFRREGRAESAANTWALEIEPGRTLVYAMTRPDGRRFELVFDLTKPRSP